MARMLAESNNVIAFRECLYNRTPFDVTLIAKAVISRAHRIGNYVLEISEKSIHVNSADKFFSAASPEFLRCLIEIGSANCGASGEAVALLSLAELFSRNVKVNGNIVHHRLRGLCAHPEFRVDVDGHTFKFSDAIST